MFEHNEFTVFCLLVCYITPVASYLCEICSLALKEKHRFKVSEKKVFRIFEQDRVEVTEVYGKLHSDELSYSVGLSNTINEVGF
jgi:hypothetical protein